MNVENNENLVERVINMVPAQMRAAVEKLAERPLSSGASLAETINQYSRTINTAAAARPDLDINLAECISRSLLSLLQDNWHSMDEQQRTVLQIACYYYIEEDDDQGDLESVYGFDDDAELLNAVLDCLGRSDLTVQI
jgi:hypothetical protein